jgi:flagellar basal body-associated protein FliL
MADRQDEPLIPEQVDAKEEKAAKIKKIAMLALALAVIFVGGGYFIIKLFSGKKTPEKEHAAPVEAEHLPAQNVYLDLGQITVGLSPSAQKREYLRIYLTLRLHSEVENNAVMAKVPIIKDSLIGFLRTLRATDFNSSSNTLYLKEEILKRLNKITAPIVIKEILFQEITVN